MTREEMVQAIVDALIDLEPSCPLCGEVMSREEIASDVRTILDIRDQLTYPPHSVAKAEGTP